MVDTPIVSESLQKSFRDNFPSQINSGRDLHVSDVVVPIVDFSAQVSTSGIGQNLQTAISYGNANAFSLTSNTTITIVNTTGFWRLSCALICTPGNGDLAEIIITDGSTPKVVYGLGGIFSGGTGDDAYVVDFDKIIFLNTGESLQCKVAGTPNYSGAVIGSARQIADISGTLVNPTGYTGQ